MHEKWVMAALSDSYCICRGKDLFSRKDAKAQKIALERCFEWAANVGEGCTVLVP